MGTTEPTSTRALLGQSWRTRIAVAGLRLLAWSNGLEAAMGFIGIAWCVGVFAYPPPPGLEARMGLSQQIGVVLIPVLLVALIALQHRWRWVRMATSLAAFLCWGLMAATTFAAVADTDSRIGIVFVAYALIELGIFVRLKTHMDTLRDTLEAAVLANNAAVSVTGRAPSPRGGHHGSLQERP